MIEKRQFPRVRLTAKSILSFQNADYRGQLENISISGALIRLEQCIIVRTGGEYILTIYIEGEVLPLQIVVEVVCATPSLAGIKFIACDGDTAFRLRLLIEKLTTDPEVSGVEQERIRIHLANYLQEA